MRNTRVRCSAERTGKFKLFDSQGSPNGCGWSAMRNTKSGGLMLNVIFICDSIVPVVCKEMKHEGLLFLSSLLLLLVKSCFHFLFFFL